MAYAHWKKGGKLLFACRVVGLALEALFKSEAQAGYVEAEHCATVEFWKTQKLQDDESWSEVQTCFVPVLPAHQRLALYIMQRICRWLSGLNLVVLDAVVAKSRREGTGHHDLKLKHAVPSRFYCQGFLSCEMKTAQVQKNGRGFGRVWDDVKEASFDAMARVLQAPSTTYGAALLIVVGICDSEELLAASPPLLVKAQLMVLDANGAPKWGQILLDKGTVPTEPTAPLPKRQRQGASWDEVQAILSDKGRQFEGTDYVRLLDVFLAISVTKTNKNPGQKMATYQKKLGLVEDVDFIRKRAGRTKGSTPYWLTRSSVRRIYDFETFARTTA